MIERDKQRTDQEKKHAAEKERREHPHRDVKVQPGQRHARSDTDPKAPEDKDYLKRSNEKTEKH